MKTFAAERIRREGVTFGRKLLIGVGLAIAISGLILGVSTLSIVGAAFALATRLSALFHFLPRSRSVVNVDDGSLLVGTGKEATPFAFGDLATGYVRGSTAVIETHDGERLLLTLGSPAACDELLSLVGLTQDKRTLELPLRGMIGSFTRGFLALTVGPIIGGFLAAAALALSGQTARAPANVPLWGWIVGALPTIALVVWFFRTRNPHVVTGADGVRILLGRTRFIPYKAIKRVNAQPGAWDVSLELRAGGIVELPVIGQAVDQVGVLVRRIEAGIAGVAEEAPDLSALDRGGRDLDGWRTSLAELVKPAQDFRSRRIAPDDLERVLGDPRAPGERRVAAAIALGAIDPERARDQARVAAGAAANEKVRIALDAVATDALEEAHLAELEAADASAERLTSRRREPS